MNTATFYLLLADLVLLVHLLFVLFVLLGGFLVIRWPRLIWLHIPALAWGSTSSSVMPSIP